MDTIDARDVKGIGNVSACRIIEFCENYEG